MGSASPFSPDVSRCSPIPTVICRPSYRNLPPISDLLSDKLIAPVHKPWTEIPFFPSSIDISAKLSMRHVRCKICSPRIGPRDICNEPRHAKRLATILSPHHVESGEIQSVLLPDRKI